MCPISKFLQEKANQKNNETAFVALLMLGAIEREKPELLLRFDVDKIRTLMWKHRMMQLAKANQKTETIS